MSFYRDKKVLVTGGAGFLGMHLVEALLARGAQVRAVGRRPRPGYLPTAEYLVADLTDAAEREKALRGIELVFHLAAVGWGLRENMQRQPELLTSNLLLNTAMLDAAYRPGVQGYLYTSSSAVYPGGLEELSEAALWSGPPHPSELNFGWAKRMGEIQARAYFEYYRMPIAIVRPCNPYGPWDSFDLHKSHVIPALIRRALAKENPFTVWGTGRARRSFIFAPDLTQGMLLALERRAVYAPINLASNETTSIAELARLILELCDHREAALYFDPCKPEGHPRKVPSVRRAQEIGLVSYTPLREGLRQTIAWYLGQLNGRAP